MVKETPSSAPSSASVPRMLVPGLFPMRQETADALSGQLSQETLAGIHGVPRGTAGSSSNDRKQASPMHSAPKKLFQALLLNMSRQAKSKHLSTSSIRKEETKIMQKKARQGMEDSFEKIFLAFSFLLFIFFLCRLKEI